MSQSLSRRSFLKYAGSGAVSLAEENEAFE